ncbi:MAG: acylphosphatase [Calditrichaeota bacterium]|nr:acylphosphatase [Anaerolineaceae bacterium]RQV93706.1 MAG: acylphosphatase [Calditrichota bacterium]
MNSQGINKDQLHVLVSGRVQGVGFRFFVKYQADRLNLTGYVRNMPEGQVEVLAEGLPKDLDQLLTLIWMGPSGALVVDVIQNRCRASGKYHDFEIEPRAGY